MIGEEICKALGLDAVRITKLEMTFTAQQATVIATLAHLDTDRPAGKRLVETLRTFELVERSADSAPSPAAPSVVIECARGVEAYRVETLAEPCTVEWLKTSDATTRLEGDEVTGLA